MITVTAPWHYKLGEIETVPESIGSGDGFFVVVLPSTRVLPQNVWVAVAAPCVSVPEIAICAVTS